MSNTHSEREKQIDKLKHKAENDNDFVDMNSDEEYSKIKKEKTELAVSPVIGIILMIAITVILAAVIASMIFGMSGNLQNTKLVSLSASAVNNSAVRVILNGGNNVDELTSLMVTGDIKNPSSMNITVGSQKEFILLYGLRSHIVVTGTFIDDTQQVLLDTYV